VGFESLFMQLWKVRERVMDVLELTAGNRVIISVSKVGGTRRDISEENLKLIMKTLDELQKEMDEILPTLLNNYTLKKRTQGIGAIPADQCRELGAVGPTLRASGVAEDMRMKGYGGYKLLPFEPITETNGDAYARALVRAKELYQTFDLIRDAIKELSNHGPEIDTKVKGRPKGSSMVRIEAPRGEVMYLLVGNGSKKLERMRVRVPTFANVPMLLTMLPGEDFSNVPTLTLSIDPCISCTER
jgi:ech hydrogenase subunit E